MKTMRLLLRKQRIEIKPPGSHVSKARGSLWPQEKSFQNATTKDEAGKKEAFVLAFSKQQVTRHKRTTGVKLNLVDVVQTSFTRHNQFIYRYHHRVNMLTILLMVVVVVVVLILCYRSILLVFVCVFVHAPPPDGSSLSVWSLASRCAQATMLLPSPLCVLVALRRCQYQSTLLLFISTQCVNHILCGYPQTALERVSKYLRNRAFQEFKVKAAQEIQKDYYAEPLQPCPL